MAARIVNWSIHALLTTLLFILSILRQTASRKTKQDSCCGLKLSCVRCSEQTRVVKRARICATNSWQLSLLLSTEPSKVIRRWLIPISFVELFVQPGSMCYFVLYRFFIASVRIPEQYTTVYSKLLLSNSNSLCKTFLASDFAFLVTLVTIIIIKSYIICCHTHHAYGVLKLHLSTIVRPFHVTN